MFLVVVKETTGRGKTRRWGHCRMLAIRDAVAARGRRRLFPSFVIVQHPAFDVIA